MPRLWKYFFAACAILFLTSNVVSIILLITLNTQARELGMQIDKRTLSPYIAKQKLFDVANYTISVVFITIMNMGIVIAVALIECTGIQLFAQETTAIITNA